MAHQGVNDNESKESITDVTPGFFHFDPPMFDKVIKSGKLQSHIEDYMYMLEQGEEYVDIKTAVYNIIAVLYFRKNDIRNAIITLKTLLSTNPHNLNGLANLEYLYKESKNIKDAIETRKKIDQMMNDSKVEVTREKARCLADQGFALAHMFEIYGDNDALQNLTESNNYFENAISCARNDLDLAEIVGWKINIGKNLTKMKMQWYLDGSSKNSAAIVYFCKLLDEEHNNNLLLALTWMHLGNALVKQEADGTQFETRYTPEKCFENSLRLGGEHSFIKARYARFLFGKAKRNYAVSDLNNAHNIMKDMLATSDAPVNWKDRASMAQICITWYKGQDKYDNPGNKDLLLEARDQMQQVLQDGFDTIKNLGDIAEICFLLGKHNKIATQEEEQDFIGESLRYINTAKNTDEISNRALSFLLLLEGDCMKLLGQKTQALECFQSSFEINPQHIRPLHSMLELKLEFYEKYMSDDILTEMIPFFERGCTLFGNEFGKHLTSLTNARRIGMNHVANIIRRRGDVEVKKIFGLVRQYSGY